ncbi:hypothetical protein P154DRAFT_597314 [Amniculicola lignicola CBS 123094]|uniref:Uncharacterized protein n=1 Tax=Amniculicola lignicola CBS 123094 TaxID=1392246 RepID=A0A6A5X0M3_9PLEO|nr:hypothetical protein P154DRAFT_597314 [Amniculicola lignicola CBS 123094]
MKDKLEGPVKPTFGRVWRKVSGHGNRHSSVLGTISEEVQRPGHLDELDHPHGRVNASVVNGSGLHSSSPTSLGLGSMNKRIDGEIHPGRKVEFSPKLPTVSTSEASIWDPEEEEFHRWPEANQITHREKNTRKAHSTHFESMRDRRTSSNRLEGRTYRGSITSRHQNSLIDLETHISREPSGPSKTYRRTSTLRYRNIQTNSDIHTSGVQTTDDQYPEPSTYDQATIEQLVNMEYGNPDSEDLHDRRVSQYIIPHSVLPSHLPIQHMHLLNERSYNTSGILACPRLCDTVATVLFETHPKCLNHFLDPAVSTFEWERLDSFGHSAVIRRVGYKVLVGTYKNHGFMLLFRDYVKSVIDFTGKWTEVYAAVSSGTIPCNIEGPDWENYTPTSPQLDPRDPKTMLAFSRRLARQLIRDRCWDYYPPSGERVVWNADGIISRGKMQSRTDMERTERDSTVPEGD